MPRENSTESAACNSWHRMHRRRMLGLSAATIGVSGWTSIAETLARASEGQSRHKPAKSIIVLWLQGGPSQLETFDPHPDTKIGGETKAIETSAKGIKISHLLPQTAEQMHHASIIRSMVSKEGDHERATYNVKTGWRPDPTLVHPSIGSVLCHQTEDNIEIPRHVSILSGQWPARGGYLGPLYDAFQMDDPRNPLPNLKSYISEERQKVRLKGLRDVVEQEFAKGRLQNLNEVKTLQSSSTQAAIKMMESEQISAFDVGLESKATQELFGDTPFGRGCLAAVRLVETGVRCVEVELSGWDTHINNHSLQSALCKTLDAALAATLAQLHERGLLESTLVFCGGEFGRTPTINVSGGRDHWPTGFSVLLAGGGIRKGQVVGETSSEPDTSPEKRMESVSRPVPVENLHATMLRALGVSFEKELKTPVGRPLVLSQGEVVPEILDGMA